MVELIDHCFFRRKTAEFFLEITKTLQTVSKASGTLALLKVLFYLMFHMCNIPALFLSETFFFLTRIAVRPEL